MEHGSLDASAVSNLDRQRLYSKHRVTDSLFGQAEMGGGGVFSVVTVEAACARDLHALWLGLRVDLKTVGSWQ